MTNADETLRELVRLNREPYGTARTLAAEQVLRLVEAAGPEELRAYAYSTLVDSLVWGGEIDKAYVPFTRWVRWYDEHPEHFDEQDRHHLFWSFKWMVGHLSDYPQVPFEQIEATLADMERRYALLGQGMHGVQLEKFRWAWLREAPETEQLFREWSTGARDEFSNCEACDPSEQALYLADQGRLEEAVRIIEQTLASDPSCGTEPADMLSQLAAYQLELGRPVEAARAYRRAVRALEDCVSAMATTRGRLAETLARGGQLERAVRRVEQDEHLLGGSDTPHSHFAFLGSTAAAMRLVASSEPERPVRVTHAPVSTAAELARWAESRARALAQAFDERNRSDSFERELETKLSRGLAPAPLDLAVVPRPAPEASDRSSEPVPGASDPDVASGELVARADRLVSRGELLEAAPLYAEAATLLQASGELEEAGLAEANAARCAHELEDIPGADAAYRRAIALLRAGGASPALVSAVARSWVPLAFEAGSAEDALALLEQQRAVLLAELEGAEVRELRTEVAESLDTQARALATLGQPERAVALASEAAERFAGVGRVADAAHAFWLAGRVLVAEARDEEAVFHLESAVEGFSMARDRAQRGKAATDLVEVLRRLGRAAEADEAAAGLGS